MTTSSGNPIHTCELYYVNLWVSVTVCVMWHSLSLSGLKSIYKRTSTLSECRASTLPKCLLHYKIHPNISIENWLQHEPLELLPLGIYNRWHVSLVLTAKIQFCATAPRLPKVTDWYQIDTLLIAFLFFSNSWLLTHALTRWGRSAYINVYI